MSRIEKNNEFVNNSNVIDKSEIIKLIESAELTNSSDAIFISEREQYRNVLGETAAAFTTQNVAEFNPRGTMPGSDLPAGELSMNQIMNLMNR